MPVVSKAEAQALAARAKLAAVQAASSSEDKFFDAVQGHVAGVIGAGIDALVRAKASDPVRYLGEWLLSASGASSSSGGDATASAAGAGKRSAADVRDLKAQVRLLEEDNDTMKDMVTDLEHEVASLKKQLAEAKRARVVSKKKAAGGDDAVGAFTLDDDSDS